MAESYQVFALRWRPQRFADVVGQEHVTRPLQNAIREGRVPHAFLLTGARGVGKTTTARILAKALVCEKGPAPEPCNECRFCREVTAGSAIDVVEMDAASNTGIDDVRDLRESLAYAPAAARFKVYIVDEVHMLSKAAFNAFLKTLEEPPPHVKFIFATTELHKVPITIQSRCQRYDFRLLDRAEIVEQLRRIVEAEGIAMSPAALGAVAAAGEGSLRDAESLLEQVVAYCGRTVPRRRGRDRARAPRGEDAPRLLRRTCSRAAARPASPRSTRWRPAAWTPASSRARCSACCATSRCCAPRRRRPTSSRRRPRPSPSCSSSRRRRARGTCSRSSRSSCASRPRCAPRPSRACCSSWRCCAPWASRSWSSIETLLARLEGLELRLAAGLPPGRRGAAARGAGARRRRGPSAGGPRRRIRGSAVGGVRRHAAAHGSATACGAGAPRAATPPAARAPRPLPRRPPGRRAVRAARRARAARPRAMLGDFLEHGRLVQAGDGVIEIGFAPADSFFLDTARETENMACLRAAARELLGGRAEVRLTTLGGDGGGAGNARARRARATATAGCGTRRSSSEPLRWAMEILEAHVVDVKLDQ